MTCIRGITWDHPRGYQPLKALAAAWNEKNEVQVSWDVRTLKEFGDYPIEKLIGRYDLIVIDHPYVGSAAADNLLAPLDEHLPAAFMKRQEAQSLGACFGSYRYAGHYWALPIDAAAQVAAYRKDLIDELKWTPPSAITGLQRAAGRLPEGKTIGIPLCPTDIWCVFLSLSALYSNGRCCTEKGIDAAAGEWALGQIRNWRDFLYPGSFSMNPIQMLDHMAAHDDIVYVPYTFGYTNYARKGWRERLIHFGDSPGMGKGRCAPILGGAGLAIAAQTEHLADCLAFMQFVLSEENQKGIYFREQGQPAHLSAWTDKDNDEACSGFFSGTMATMQRAFVRPRHKGFNRFQEAAADLIHEAATAGDPYAAGTGDSCAEGAGDAAEGPYVEGTGDAGVKEAIRRLNELYQIILHGAISAY